MPPRRDPGLQPERTRLAWRRTTLALAVAEVLGVRQALHGGVSPAVAVTVAGLVLVLLGFLVLAHRRIQALGGPRPPLLSSRTAAFATGCTVALAAFGAALVR